MKKLCLLILLLALLLKGELVVAVTAPTLDGKLAIAYDGSDTDLVWDALGGVWRVTSLNDQVGGYNALAPSEARRPILAQMDTGNGLHPVIDFDGVNDYLLTSAFAVPMQQDNMILIVASRDTAGSSYLIDGLDNASDHKVSTISSGRHFMGAGTTVLSGHYANTQVFEIYTAVFQSGSGGNSRLFITDAAGTTQVLFGDVGSHSLGGLKIGSYASGGGYLNGQIAELLVYDGAMSTVQMESVQQYLLEKYMIGESCPSPPEYDLNEDCDVDFSDMVLFIESWLDSGLWP